MLFCSLSFHFVLMLMRKILIPTGASSVCGVFMFSPHLCVFSLGTLVSSHVAQMCLWGELSCLHCPSVTECRCGGEGPCNGRATVRVAPACCSELLGGAPATLILKWTLRVGKSFFYLCLFIFLKCVCSSHIFQYFILKVFGSLFRNLVMSLWPELCCRNLTLIDIN